MSDDLLEPVTLSEIDLALIAQFNLDKDEFLRIKRVQQAEVRAHMEKCREEYEALLTKSLPCLE